MHSTSGLEYPNAWWVQSTAVQLQLPAKADHPVDSPISQYILLNFNFYFPFHRYSYICIAWYRIALHNLAPVIILTCPSLVFRRIRSEQKATLQFLAEKNFAREEAIAKYWIVFVDPRNPSLYFVSMTEIFTSPNNPWISLNTGYGRSRSMSDNDTINMLASTMPYFHKTDPYKNDPKKNVHHYRSSQQDLLTEPVFTLRRAWLP